MGLQTDTNKTTQTQGKEDTYRWGMVSLWVPPSPPPSLTYLVCIREAEIHDLDVSLPIQQKVLRLQVPDRQTDRQTDSTGTTGKRATDRQRHGGIPTGGDTPPSLSPSLQNTHLWTTAMRCSFSTPASIWRRNFHASLSISRPWPLM